MYVKRVRLSNFMRYESLDLELDPGFNAFVGQTDSGKSTILRALIWVFYNKPLGTDMLRAGSDETSVVVNLQHGEEEVEVERFRSKKRNAYRLGETWFDNFGNDVPQAVKDAIGVDFAEMGQKQPEMLNVSRQMDGPFLLSQSGGDAAKILGNLSGLTKIDQGLASLRPDLSAAKKAIDAAAKQERSYHASIGEFEHLDQEEAHLEAISTQLGQARAASDRLVKLKDVQARMASYNQTVTTIDADIAGVQARLQILLQTQQLDGLMARRQQLHEVLGQMDEYNRQDTELSELITGARADLCEAEESLKATLHAAGVCPLCGSKT